MKSFFQHFSLIPPFGLPLLVVFGTGYLLTHNIHVAFACGLVAGLWGLGLVAWVRRRVNFEEKRLLKTVEELSLALPSASLQPQGPSTVIHILQHVRESLHTIQKHVDTLEDALDSMADGVWLTDVEGNIVQANDTLRRLLHWEGPLMGQRPLAVLRSAELQEAIEKACQGGATQELDVAMDKRTLAIRVVPLHRGIQGSAAIFHDVTALRGLEKMRRDFVANVSHELGTPLTAIRGYAETLKSGAIFDEKNAPRMVDIIFRQAERLSNLVEDLLKLSRLESRSVEFKPAPVDVRGLVERAWEVVGRKAADKEIAFDLQVPKGLLAFVDSRGLEQVLLNLLDNAVKYTPTGGKVCVQARAEDNRCVLEVIDSGIGIETIHLARIFERFYRVDAGRARDMGGTGLGLSIVKHLMSAMNGDIRVHSTVGKGSIFQAFMPLSSLEEPRLM